MSTRLATLLFGMLALLAVVSAVLIGGPGSASPRLEAPTPATESESARAAAPAEPAAENSAGVPGVETSEAAPRRREEGERQAVAGFVVRGRLVFPRTVPTPDDVVVYAVERTAGQGFPREEFARVLAAGSPRALVDRADGRFTLELPGPEPLARNWVLIAGTVGWVGSVVFPDPRPQSPPPDAEVEVGMEPVFAATYELVGPDGRPPALTRALLEQAGGPGTYEPGGWSVTHPASLGDPAHLLALAPGLAPVTGGADPARGLGRTEAAVVLGNRAAWEAGTKELQFGLRLPGYQPIQSKLRFGPLAGSEPLPHHRIVLEPLRPTGTLEIRFERAAWWNPALEPAGLSAVRLVLEDLEPEPALPAEQVGPGGAPREWTVELATLPDDGVVRWPGIPAGRHRLVATARESGVVLPVHPQELVIPAGGLAESRIDCGAFGALRLRPSTADPGEWASGRLQFLAVHSEQMSRFPTDAWPVVLGPLPAEPIVVLIRSIDRRTPPGPADRLDHEDIFPVLAGAVTEYLVQGVR